MCASTFPGGDPEGVMRGWQLAVWCRHSPDQEEVLKGLDGKGMLFLPLSKECHHLQATRCGTQCDDLVVSVTLGSSTHY